MTIVQKIDSRKLKAQKAYVNAYYEGNVFLADDPKSFFLLWQLLETHKDNWLHELLTNMLWYGVKTWLNSLFLKKNDKSEMNLTTEDIVHLVLNNITILPGCKCKIRKLRINAN